ncbi:NH3-dependent NAD+ synthetase [Halanaeroarchaeum sp. HSR-CO]|uniref:NAD+ synthase n=1 Tax=Halanaeroarchaeum sp. HSR-CO TaxID=2866382 RepID=UPI00217E9A36|nr:NAD+ synthase [Halanaeroarchaeum sp. HSR-CO]UWG48870.1 NH3-dependent NAD+ synthetase [Halanaeroarchaeum sp. HSR-CO]
MSDPDAIEPLDLRFSETELADRRESIVEFIQDSMGAAGADRAILGLSGGIDSTTTAHLAVEALGADALHALVMPGAVSEPENMSDAEWVAQELGVEYDLVEINPFVDLLLDTFGEAEDDYEAVGNARARTRAVINYLVANHENGLVLGTGNRTEAMVGYFTKFGDGAVDVNPLGNLYKQQVRQLARSLDVPEELVTKTPTAGLWAGQTDEDELGIDYDTLDAILALHVDGPLSATATARAIDEDEAVVERIAAMARGSEHKRTPPTTPTPP